MLNFKKHKELCDAITETRTYKAALSVAKESATEGGQSALSKDQRNLLQMVVEEVLSNEGLLENQKSEDMLGAASPTKKNIWLDAAKIRRETKEWERGWSVPKKERVRLQKKESLLYIAVVKEIFMKIGPSGAVREDHLLLTALQEALVLKEQVRPKEGSVVPPSNKSSL